MASEELAEADDASDEEEASADDDASEDEALVEPMPPIPPTPVVATELLASEEDAELASVELAEELAEVDMLVDDAVVEEELTTDELVLVDDVIPPAPPCGRHPMFDSTQTFPLLVFDEDVEVAPSSQAETTIANASGVAKEIRRFLRITYSCN